MSDFVSWCRHLLVPFFFMKWHPYIPLHFIGSVLILLSFPYLNILVRFDTASCTVCGQHNYIYCWSEMYYHVYMLDIICCCSVITEWQIKIPLLLSNDTIFCQLCSCNTWGTDQLQLETNCLYNTKSEPFSKGIELRICLPLWLKPIYNLQIVTDFQQLLQNLQDSRTDLCCFQNHKIEADSAIFEDNGDPVAAATKIFVSLISVT